MSYVSNIVPKGWNAAPISEICNIAIGGTPSRSVSEYWDSAKTTGSLWVSIRDLSTPWVYETSEYITELGIKNSNVKLVKKGTVLMSFKLSVGRVAFAGRDLYTNEAIVAFLPKDKGLLSNQFLYQGLQQWNLLENIDQAVKGITLNKEKINQIEALLPPLSEQQKIATILSSVDDVIEKTRAQIDKLKDLKTGMMQELLTKGIGHTEFKDSPVGFIPINWEVKQIGEMVVKVGSGITPRGGSASYVDVGIPLIRSQNVHSDGLRLDDVSYITETQHAKMSGSQLKSFDVLLNITGASIGRCYYLPPDFKEGNVNQHVCIIRLKQEVMDSVFLTFCLNSELGQRQVMSLQAGGNREGLNFQQVRAIRLAVPPIDEQKRIAEIVSSIEKNIRNKLAKLAHLSDTKKALMQDLLTGKVRVNLTDKESAVV